MSQSHDSFEPQPCNCGFSDLKICYESPQSYWVECCSCGNKSRSFASHVQVMLDWNRMSARNQGNQTDRSILLSLLREAHDEIEWMNQQYLQDDPMGLRSTPPRISRLLDKMKGILGD